MEEIIQKMISNATYALKNAYAPYSKFLVGACIQSGDKLFTGVNVENSSYSLTLCAESSAIAQMISAGYRKIDSIVILAHTNKLCPPCGACRQRIQEFATEHTLVHLCNKDSVLETYSMKDLLPLAFNLNGN